MIPLGPERVHLRSPSIHLAIKSEMALPLTEPMLQGALFALQAKYQILRTTIALDPEGRAFYRTNSARSLEGILVDEVPGRSWESKYEKWDALPFDLCEGPLVRVVALSHGEWSTVLLIGHHLVGDGLSFLNLMESLALALDGRLDPEPVGLEVLGQRSRFQLGAVADFLIKRVARRLNLRWRSDDHVFSPEEFSSLYAEYRNQNSLGLDWASLEEHTAALILGSRDHGVTVNSAVLTAFLASVQKVAPSRPDTGVGIAVNVRKDLRPTISPESVGNYASGVHLKLTYDQRQEFWANVVRNHRLIRLKLSRKATRASALTLLSHVDGNLIDSLSFALYGGFSSGVSQSLARILKTHRQNKILGVSNLGVWTPDAPRMSQVLFIPPAFPANDINLGLVTYQGEMALCVRWTAQDRLTVKAILEETGNLLRGRSLGPRP